MTLVPNLIHDANPIAPVAHRDSSDGANDAHPVPSLQTLTPGLTEKQHALYLFIAKFTREKGFSPSFDEMAAAMDLKSKSGIHRLIKDMELRGYVRRLGRKARSVEIIDKGDLLTTAQSMYLELSKIARTLKPDHPYRDKLDAKLARWRDAVMP